MEVKFITGATNKSKTWFPFSSVRWVPAWLLWYHIGQIALAQNQDPRYWQASVIHQIHHLSLIFFHQCIIHFYQTILDKNLAGITFTYDLTGAVTLKNSTQKSEWLLLTSTSHQPPTTRIHDKPLCRIWIQDITKCVGHPSMHYPSLMSLVYYLLIHLKLSWMTTS